MPTFTVVICTYNRAVLVPGAIRSVLAQTFRDFELVVVDDGSTDDTRMAVSRFDDVRLRYLYRCNGGLSAARNTGVSNASGRFVTFLDDDDEAMPQWLEQLQAGLGGDPDAVVTCGELVVDERGRPVHTLLPRALGPAFEGYRGLFVPGTFAVPRSTYTAVGGFAEGLLCSHQTEFALRLLPWCRERGVPVRSVEEPLVRHVLRSSNRRPESTPAKVLSGAKFVLDRHEARLAKSPDLLADWFSTAGVAAARVGDYREARRLFGRATRARPWRLKHAARLALACVPPVGDVAWKTRRYREDAGVPGPTRHDRRVSGYLLHVVTTTDRRGAEVFGVELAEALARRGWSSRTVALVSGNESTRLPVPALGRGRLSPRTLLRLRREVRRADLVIAHGSTTLPACAIALAGSRRPFVYRNIGDPTQWSTTPLRRARTRWALHRARATVALASASADEIARRYRVDPARIRVIPRGVPAARFPAIDADERRGARARFDIPQDSKTVVHLGNLSPEKNVALAIDAIALLPDVHLLVVGGGPERAKLERHAAEHAPDQVTLVGSTDEPALALAAADAVVLPSRTEGLPGVLIEAGLRGLPVVATDVGYVREIVIDEVTGFIVPPADPASMAAALDRAVASAKELGPAARAHCLDRFDLEVVTGAWEQLLSELISA